MEHAVAQPHNRSVWLSLLEKLGPILLAVAFAYGTVKYTEGQTQQRLADLESDSKGFVSREEFKQFTEGAREDLREIKQDVRAIRSDLQRR